MAGITLYDEAVSYPAIQAVNNGKLEFSKQDTLVVIIPCRGYQVTGHRAATTDPWQIEITPVKEHDARVVFGLPAVTCNPDDLGWKSMADLVLKAHGRPTSDQEWPLISVGADRVNPWRGDGPFVIGTNPVSVPTLAQIQSILTATVAETGDITLHYKSNGTSDAVMNVGTRLATNIAECIGAILAKTTETNDTQYTKYALADERECRAALEHTYTLTSASGTESISVGNYGLGQRRVLIESGGSNGRPYAFHVRRVGQNGVFTIPSIVMDGLRKSAKAASLASIIVINDEKDGSVSSTERWINLGSSGSGDLDVMTASTGDPSGVYEIGFDQANSLNVLATAAFSGLAGLAGVGVATELQTLLANSQLSPIFQNVATALGSTTSAVITGYVGALVAAYTQGWISDAQLFNLQNHVQWIQGGTQAILAAGAAGIAIGELPSLLSYLGVSNNVLSIALSAAGGAATGAGVALGMASVMAKCVRHTYWGV